MNWEYFRKGEARHDLNQRVWMFRDWARRTFYPNWPALCPWLVSAHGTDCDGMRWDSVHRHWTKRAAREEIEHQSEWADGPIYCRVVFAWSKAGNHLRRNGVGWSDDRDRFAEDDGY